MAQPDCEHMNKFVRRFVVALLFASLVFTAAGEGKDREKQEIDIQEAALSYAFGHTGVSRQRTPQIFFVAIANPFRDPSKELLARLGGHDPVLRMYSSCEVKAQDIVDRITGGQGACFILHDVMWCSNSEAVVDVGYCEGHNAASLRTLTLKLEAGKWAVTKVETKVES